jgi:membrane associated rhomboid family serine protease
LKKYKKSNLGESLMTLIIVVTNIIIFVLLNTIPHLVEKVALYPEVTNIIQKPWTLVSAAFSHEVSIHIIGNMFVLFYFCRELEKILGPIKLLVTYLISGLVGSIALIVAAELVGFTGHAVGASAAAFGVLGALIVVAKNDNTIRFNVKKALVPVASTIVVMNVVMGFMKLQSLGPSSAAHLSGIAVGLILGYCLKRKSLSKV